MIRVSAVFGKGGMWLLADVHLTLVPPAKGTSMHVPAREQFRKKCSISSRGCRREAGRERRKKPKETKCERMTEARQQEGEGEIESIKK